MWRLWLEGKLQMSEFDKVSLDGVLDACDALDAWQGAIHRANEKARKR